MCIYRYNYVTMYVGMYVYVTMYVCILYSIWFCKEFNALLKIGLHSIMKKALYQ